MPKDLVAMMRVTAIDGSANRTFIGYVHQDGRGYAAWDTAQRWLGNTMSHRFATDHAAVTSMIHAAKLTLGSVRQIHWQADR